MLSNGTNSFGSVTIVSGTLQGSQGTAGQLTSLGSGSVTLGDIGGSATATLEAAGTLPTSPRTPSSWGGTSGALTISVSNTGTTATFTGGITGANNVRFAYTGTLASTAGIIFSSGAINNAGTITNAFASPSTGTVMINSVVGPNA